MVLLVVLLMAFLGSVYKTKKLESAYSKNYVFALYGLKTGADLNLRKCLEISERIKNPIPGKLAVSKEEIAQLNAAKVDIDQVLSRLQNPPAKYANSHKHLLLLNDSYQRLFSFTISFTPQAAGDFTDSMVKLESDFLQKAQELKADLPEKLSNELKESVVKYKNLKFLI